MSTTPEDVARDIMQHAVVADEEAWIEYAAEVIALDRAEAKAEALAEMARENQAATRTAAHIEALRADSDRRSAEEKRKRGRGK